MPLSPRLIVEAYEHPFFRGKKVTLIEPVADLRELGADNIISSIKIFKGPSFASAPNYKAVFYDGPNFQGKALVLGPGFYPDIHAYPYNFGNRISSVSFSPVLPPTAPDYGLIPVIIEVFRDVEYRGTKNVILRDVGNAEEIGLNNAISSLRIQRGPNFPFKGCRVIFFERPYFRGRSMTIELNPREFSKEIVNLHPTPERFGDVISSIKILPEGEFNVLVVEGDTRCQEPGILASLTEVQGSRINYDFVMVNGNRDNFGDPNRAVKLSSINLDNYDIIWLTWNASGHDREYFLEDAEQMIRDFVARGGIVWCSAMDDNIVEGKGWRGGWLPVEKHPITVVNSEDVNVQVTEAGWRTGIFTWPNEIDVNALYTDDHWVTKDWRYEILARRADERREPVSFQLKWGNGYYVGFALDTRDVKRAEAARPFIENVLCYLISLAWQTSPRQRMRAARGLSDVSIGLERYRYEIISARPERR